MKSNIQYVPLVNASDEDFLVSSATIFPRPASNALLINRPSWITQFRKPSTPYPKSQEDCASMLSWMVYQWVAEIVQLGFKKPLTQEDLHIISQMDTAFKVSKALATQWGNEVGRSRCWNHKVGTVVWKVGEDNTGTLMWIGRMKYSPRPRELYAGVVWHRRNRGKHDGTSYHERHFQCEDGQGSYVFPETLMLQDNNTALPPSHASLQWA
eukprot:PhF_6_TR44171/c1_g4_i2/m.67669